MSRQRSAYASRAPSGQPASSHGPYWVNIVITTEPSSVSVESIVDGTSTSRYGTSDGTPRQASCHARSSWSIDGQNATPERTSRSWSAALTPS